MTPAVADTGPPVLPKPFSLLNGGKAAAVGAKAGYLPGSGSVASSGAFEYGIPLNVPAGRAGMAPKLSLSYSSSGGNGIAGKGWSVSGSGSVLARCGETPDSEGTRSGVHLSVNDKFCLAGQKLILISGKYGEDGAEYRTESDSYAKIISVGGVAGAPDKFVVFTKDGHVLTYSASSAVQKRSRTKFFSPPAQIGDSDSHAYGTEFDLQQFEDNQATKRTSWTLSAERDRAGNEVSYSYTDIPGDGKESLLSRITYTYGPGRAAQRWVDFSYEDRPDLSFSYQAGVRYKQTKRLRKISMWAPNPGAVEEVRSYTLAYLPAAVGSADRSQSLLASVQECGSGVTGSATVGCLPKKEFTWSESLHKPSFSSHDMGSVPIANADTFGDNPNMLVADFNGDGLDDVLNGTGFNTHTLRLGSRDPASPLQPGIRLDGKGNWPKSAVNFSVNLAHSRPLDVNSSGRTELSVAQSDGGDVGVHKENHLLRWDDESKAFWYVDTAANLEGGDWFDYADINGDGFIDYVRYDSTYPVETPAGTITQGRLAVRLNDTHGNFKPDVTTGEDLYKDVSHVGMYRYKLGSCPRTYRDLDGDGRAELLMPKPSKGPNSISYCGPLTGTDIVRFQDNGLPVLVSGSYDGMINEAPQSFPFVGPQGTELEFENNTVINGLFGMKPLTGDFNGDGLEDTLLVSNHNRSSEGGNGSLVDHSYGQKDAIIWNTGNGQFWDGTFLDIPHDDLSDIEIRDINSDGMDDVVSFWSPALTVDLKNPSTPFDDHVTDLGGSKVSFMLAQPNGKFRTVAEVTGLYGGDAVATPVAPGRLFSRLGDFNGDGRLDITTNGKVNDQRVYIQNASEPDRITAVSDEGAGKPRQEVEYSHTWAEKLSKITENACAAPLTCLRRGMPVVRKLTTHEDSYSEDKPRSVFYSYQDPVSHVRQGFLGFGTVRSWDPSRPSETVTTYDVRTSARNGKRYPYGSLPHETTVTTPVLTDAEVAAKPATAKARVVKTVNTPVFKELNGGKTYTVNLVGSVVSTAEADVAIDWTADHVTGADEELHLTAEPSQPFRVTTTTSEFDDYGNQTRAKSVTSDGNGAGGTTTETTRTFDTSAGRILDWLISVPKTETITATEPIRGTAAYAAASDTFTLAGHGLANDDQVIFTTPAAGSNIDAGTVYFLRDVTANTFKIATSKGGAVADVTADGKAGITRAEARPVTRHVAYTADPQGRITDVATEKDNTDTDVRSAVHTDYDATSGVVTKVTTTVPGRPDQITHTEYDPVFAGQPDEDIYPSQTWTERSGLYRPSTWTAIQPAFGIPVATEDVNGVQSSAAFDDLGRITKTTGDSRPTVTTSYAATTDAAGKTNGVKATVATQTGTGTVTTSTASADQLGRTRASTTTGFKGETITTTTGYDRLGRTASVTRPVAGTATPAGEAKTFYDSLDRVTKTVTADGKTATTDYPTPFTVKSTDIAGRISEATTDLDGRPVKTTHHYTAANNTAATAVSAAEYAPAGPIRQTDDKGNLTTTVYDILGRPVTVTDPDRGTVNTTYYGNGQTDTATHLGTGEKAVYHYDDLGRTTSVDDIDTDNKTTTTHYTYDTDPADATKLATGGAGQLTTATSPDQVKTTNRYDTLGRAVGTDLTIDNTTYSHDTGYDTLGRPKTTAYPLIGTKRLQLLTAYNTHGYPSDLHTTTDGTTAVDRLWHAEERNADLALTSAKIGTNGDITQTTSYDPATGRLNSLKTTGTGGDLQNITYHYYDDGSVKDRTQNDLATNKANRVEAYTYDDFNRLATWTLTDGGIQPRKTTYDYDTTGNLTKVTNTGDNLPAVETRTYGRQDPKAGPHALTHTTATTLGGAEDYEYDKRGRMTAVKNAANTTTRTTVYTPFDLPKTIATPQGKTTYAYDAFGNRVKKTGPDGTTLYTGAFEKRTTTTGTTSYIHYLPNGLGQALTDTTGKTVIEYTLSDAQGTTSAVTDNTGSTTNQVSFHDPYGQRIQHNGVPATTTPGTNTHGYTGHEMEDDLRQINMAGRIYDPAAKTFHTPDPVTTNHPYTYVNSNPTNYTDPTGYDGTPNLGIDDLPVSPSNPSGITSLVSNVSPTEAQTCGGADQSLCITGTAPTPTTSDQTGYK
ncbi:RHS repeat-associated core domain-containing protein, partial [Streptomyces sp. NPDC007355]|uniref:RHS repeat-associated core domain-containing protein n=1 Tax=Streptomyces sp. NPDC007355 TaxID=3364778 RepID=UPI0036C9BEEC